MDLEMAAHVITWAVAVRVLAADARTVGRCLLGACVRVGAAYIAAQQRQVRARRVERRQSWEGEA